MHYNVTPKMHMLHHLIEGSEVANPLKLRAYLHESFIGVVAKLYQRTMVGNWRGTVQEAALRKYLVGLSLRAGLVG